MMKTFLYSEHLAHGAKIVDFAGWQMPLNYQSVLQEHACVRSEVGLFDISHMGKIKVVGPEALAFLNYMATNDVSGLVDGGALYTVLCSSAGTCIDDVLIYRHSKQSFFVVVNASNRQKDLDHLLKYSASYKVEVIAEYDHIGILALQGPKSKEVLKHLWSDIDSLKFMHHCEKKIDGHSITISKTGYTGECGYEVYGSFDALLSFWKFCLSSTPIKVMPIGLAARDILRLEMGFALYGHELSDIINPLESVSKWTIKMNKGPFLGKEAIMQLKESGLARHSYGVILDENAIAREQMVVLVDKKSCGVVTSGGYSPTLKRSIALIMVSPLLHLKDKIEISIRNREVSAEVVSLPFLKK